MTLGVYNLAQAQEHTHTHTQNCPSVASIINKIKSNQSKSHCQTIVGSSNWLSHRTRYSCTESAFPASMHKMALSSWTAMFAVPHKTFTSIPFPFNSRFFGRRNRGNLCDRYESYWMQAKTHSL